MGRDEGASASCTGVEGWRGGGGGSCRTQKNREHSAYSLGSGR